MPEMDETSVGRQRAPTILRVLWLFAQRLRGRMTATICLLTALCLAGVVLALDHGDHLVASMDEQTTDDAYVRADLVSIASHIGGYVESVPVADNERVEAGQTVAVIRSDDYKARLDAAEADLGAAQAAAETLNEQAVLQTSHISAAEAAVRQAEANLIQTRLEYSRQRSLATDGTTSRRALEEAHAAEQRLTAARDQAAADLTAAQQMQRVIQTQAEQARNTIASKRAGRDLARIDLGYTRITSPVSGQLSSRTILPGDYVAPGTQVALLAPLPQVWVIANFREVQIAHMRPGQAVSLTVDSAPGVVFHGTVDSLGPVSGALLALLPPDNATGNFTKVAQRFPVKIILRPGQRGLDRLRPGMSAVATVATGK